MARRHTQISLICAALMLSAVDAWALPKCIDDPNVVWSNCIGTFEEDGIIYVGEWINNKQNGDGTLTFQDGTKYVGQFRDGDFSGFGTYTHPNGDKYFGNFVDNNFNGNGTYIYADGDKYVGDFKDDQITGKGIYYYSDGERYIGEFKDKLRHGKGTYYFASGDRFRGEYRDNKRNGQGTYTYADGTIEEGIWENDVFKYANEAVPTVVSEVDADPAMPKCPDDTSIVWSNCVGTFEEDGSMYVGEWINDKQNGNGTFTFQDGTKYVGEFRDGEYDGYGTYTYQNGAKYVGEFKNNVYDGYGTFYYLNGNIHVGYFKNDLPNGFGTVTLDDGEKYVGHFKDNKISGKGTYYYSNGDRFVGEFKDDVRNGQGTYFFAGGARYHGEYKDGTRNGQGTYTHTDGTIEEGIWENDELKYAKTDEPTSVAEPVPQDDDILEASSGSGFAVSTDGYVVTNNHVIEGCQEVFVHDNGKVIPVIVVTYDLQNDLALLKGDFQPKAVLPLSDYQPQLLQDIYVAGYPFGNEISSSIKVTKGIISSLTGIGNNFSNIQIDAALQSGNSGGPIIDEMGNVVGVAVSKLDAEYMLENYGDIPENTNFGIKSSVVRSVLESNGVSTPAVSTSTMSKVELGQEIKGSTYYISCWMTMAQIEQQRTSKVLFDNLQ